MAYSAKCCYTDGLDKITRDRYAQMTKCKVLDPYEVGKDSLTADHDVLPAVTYMDIMNYYVNTKKYLYFSRFKGSEVS